MATIIRMTPDYLRAQAANCRQLTDELQEIFSKMNTIFSQMDSDWEGDRKNALLSSYNAVLPGINTLLNNIGDYVDYANESANRLESADQKVASMF